VVNFVPGTILTVLSDLPIYLFSQWKRKERNDEGKSKRVKSEIATSFFERFAMTKKERNDRSGKRAMTKKDKEEIPDQVRNDK